MEFSTILTDFNLKVQLCLIYFAHLKAGWVYKSLFKEGSWWITKVWKENVFVE